MTSGGRGLRIALAGATGALGDEVVAVLAERRFPLAAFHPFATERSLGREIEIGDELYAVRDEPPSFAEIDLLIVATPAAAASEFVRAALRASVACIDCSGSMLAEEAVCVALPEQSGVAEAVSSPLCAVPPGPALGWSYALAPLHEAAGIASVSAVSLRGASHVGVQGMELLSEQTIAVLNSQDPPEQQVLPGAVAFDAVPWVEPGEAGGDGSTRAEDAAAVGLRRGLRAEFPVAVTAVRVPTFVGDGSALQVCFERPLSAGRGAREAGEGAVRAPRRRRARLGELARCGRQRRGAGFAPASGSDRRKGPSAVDQQRLAAALRRQCGAPRRAAPDAELKAGLHRIPPQK